MCVGGGGGGFPSFSCWWLDGVVTSGRARSTGDWATPAPGLKCCLAKTSARGGVHVGVTKSVGGGEKHEASRSHIATVVALRVASAWSRCWSPRAPPSEIAAGGGDHAMQIKPVMSTKALQTYKLYRYKRAIEHTCPADSVPPTQMVALHVPDNSQ